jgi:hypothetical protein
MAQWVRAPDCSSEGPEFKSQQPHGGSQPSVTRSDPPLLECLKTATVYLHIINKYIFKKKKEATKSQRNRVKLSSSLELLPPPTPLGAGVETRAYLYEKYALSLSWTSHQREHLETFHIDLLTES